MSHFTNIFSFTLIAFSLSWLSPLVNFYFLGFNIFEPFLFLGLFGLLFVNKHLRNSIAVCIYDKKLFILIILLAMCAPIGFIRYSFSSIQDSYADARSIVIFAITFLIFKENRFRNDYRILMIKHLIPLIILFDLLSLQFRPANDENIKQVVSVALPAIMIVYHLSTRSLTKASIYMVILLYEAAFSYLRFYYLISIIMGLLFIIHCIRLALLNRSKNVKFKSTIILTITALIIPILFSNLVDFFEQDPQRMIHSVNRSADFIANGSSTEVERVNSVLVVLTRPDKFIIPHGLGWRSHVKEIENSFREYYIISSMDSGFFFLAYHLGLFFCLYLVLSFAYLMYLKVVSKPSDAYVFINWHTYVLISIALLSFFTSAAVFSNPQSSFSFACAIGIGLFNVKRFESIRF